MTGGFVGLNNTVPSLCLADKSTSELYTMQLLHAETSEVASLALQAPDKFTTTPKTQHTLSGGTAAV